MKVVEQNPIPLHEPTSLWDQAYESLRELDSKLVREYEDLIKKELHTIGMNILHLLSNTHIA